MSIWLPKPSLYQECFIESHRESSDRTWKLTHREQQQQVQQQMWTYGVFEGGGREFFSKRVFVLAD